MNDKPDHNQSLAEIRATIATLDTNWQRRHNLLLDEIVVIGDQMSELTQKVDRLAEGQEVMQSSINQLAKVMVQFAINAEADRAEIRKIWQYLLSQRPNGQNP